MASDLQAALANMAATLQTTIQSNIKAMETSMDSMRKVIENYSTAVITGDSAQTTIAQMMQIQAADLKAMVERDMANLRAEMMAKNA